MSDDEADEEAALASDRVKNKMVQILTVVGRHRERVSKVAAGDAIEDYTYKSWS